MVLSVALGSNPGDQKIKVTHWQRLLLSYFDGWEEKSPCSKMLWQPRLFQDGISRVP